MTTKLTVLSPWTPVEYHRKDDPSVKSWLLERDDEHGHVRAIDFDSTVGVLRFHNLEDAIAQAAELNALQIDGVILAYKESIQ